MCRARLRGRAVVGGLERSAAGERPAVIPDATCHARALIGLDQRDRCCGRGCRQRARPQLDAVHARPHAERHGAVGQLRTGSQYSVAGTITVPVNAAARSTRRSTRRWHDDHGRVVPLAHQLASAAVKHTEVIAARHDEERAVASRPLGIHGVRKVHIAHHVRMAPRALREAVAHVHLIAMESHLAARHARNRQQQERDPQHGNRRQPQRAR